jgi:hypothetical protein
MSELGGKYVPLDEYNALFDDRAYEDQIRQPGLYMAYFLLSASCDFDAAKFSVKVNNKTSIHPEFQAIEFTVYNPRGVPDLPTAALYRDGQWERRIPKEGDLYIDEHRVITSFFSKYVDEGSGEDSDMLTIEPLPREREIVRPHELVTC